MQFINAKDSLVVDAIDGLLRSSGGANLARLDGYPDIKVVLRTDHRPGRVAIVAGGGSGHEPAHASFVGKGMLTAAVCGEVFASPSIDAVFAAIMAVTGKGGCLVIFKNYTGDRLNFGLAVERARALGRRVEVVIVKDDIALPDSPQPRGIAGVMFVEKIAGIKLKRSYKLDAPKGVRGRNSDNTLIKKLMNWAPSIRLEDGMEKTYKWIHDEMTSGKASVVNALPKQALAAQ
jgi:dihydroxyacetone kinase